jgi:glucose-6-phosphate 1-dehydrogenase
MYIPASLMTIFGATGDLTRRKLLPALYQLHQQGYLPSEFAVLAIGRREKSTDIFRQEMREAVAKYASRKFSEEVWAELERRIEYLQMDFQNEEAYEKLARKISSGREQGKYASNDLFYLAVAPDHFGTIVNSLKQAGLVHCDVENTDFSEDGKNNPWQRLVIEKPFGKDLNSAAELNRVITDVIPERNIYRIDHYLAKEMIQNITMLRRQNAIFEPLWNHDYIDNIQISVLEHEGVGSRGGYYDKTGALKDMIQNHLLQLVAVLAMDLPSINQSENVRDEKVKLLSSLHSQINSSNMPVVLGQYDSYRQEEKVDPDSSTDTFVALKLVLDNKRWSGVPFYLVTGKKMAEKAALVTIEFKKPETADHKDVQANLLQIGIQPREGIHLKLNTKKPTVIDEMDVAEMEYCQSCQYNFNTPDSYEKLLLDVMLGDSTRFTRWDELELSWKLTDEIAAYCRTEVHLDTYEDNTCGPESAVEMLTRDGRRWWHLAEDGSAPEAYTCRTLDQETDRKENSTGDVDSTHSEDCGCCDGRCK